MQVSKQDKALQVFYESIEGAAEELGVKPAEVQYNELQRYVKTTGDSAFFDSAGLYRKLGGFARIRDSKYPPDVTDTNVVKRQLQKKANDNRRQGLAVVDTSMTLEAIKKYSEEVFSGRVKPVKAIPKNNKPVKRYLSALLSDLHYGSDLLVEETGVATYGVMEEARRTAKVVSEIISYKPQYRKDTGLKLLLNGDLVQNQLHDQRDGDVISRQVCRAIHLLSQAIAQLSPAFPAGIEVHCQTGNHGRNKSRHFSRATNQKFDSWETVIYYSLKQACKNLSNVSFNIPLTPFSIYDCFGKVLLTHGDSVFRTGNPGSSVNVKDLSDQVNRINASLHDREEIRVVAFGHTHEAVVKPLSNGTWLIGNGALLPPDNFAVSLGIFESAAGQWLWESTEGFPVGDIRYLSVDKHTDADKTLDKIIIPWDGF